MPDMETTFRFVFNPTKITKFALIHEFRPQSLPNLTQWRVYVVTLLNRVCGPRHPIPFEPPALISYNLGLPVNRRN